jgi:type IV pilus assembly protein PilN
MAKINLLPWREELRKKRQQDFITAIGAGVVVTCILFGLVYLHIESLKEYQTARNTKLEEEIKIVDGKIKEIKDIEEKKNKLIEKIELIQNLQESRPKIVHLFDELRKVTPKGVYLTSLVQKGGDLTVVGKSESNSMISEYMDAIEQSKYLTAPKLKIVKEASNTMSGSQTKNQDNDFTMFLKQKEDKKPKEGEDAKNAATVKPGVK